MNIDIARIFFEAWHKGQTQFSLTTSGSTGPPAEILLDRNIMQWSAVITASIIKPSPSDSILCCLPCNKVGGLMMLVRSVEWQLPVEIIEPVANPFLEERKGTIVSMTPYQLYHVLNNPLSIGHLKKTRIVIIGGGELSHEMEDQLNKNNFTSTVFYHSYGMTETYSHIALRAINGEKSSRFFTPFSDVKVTVDENNCAIIKLPFELPQVNTTDILSINMDHTFEVTGRSDFIINSGGIKIQPEVIEKAIRERLNPKNNFIISSEKDTVLGNKIILIAENDFEFATDDLQFLKEINLYAVPKSIKIIEAFKRNEGGKIRRF